jgi:hypothetical protein
MSSPDEGRRPIKRALLSVYDKTGLVELARALAGAGVEIVSPRGPRGGTPACSPTCGSTPTPSSCASSRSSRSTCW